MSKKIVVKVVASATLSGIIFVFSPASATADPAWNDSYGQAGRTQIQILGDCKSYQVIGSSYGKPYYGHIMLRFVDGSYFNGSDSDKPTLLYDHGSGKEKIIAEGFERDPSGNYKPVGEPYASPRCSD